MSVSKNTTKRMLWRIIHTLESKSKGGGGRGEMIVLCFERLRKRSQSRYEKTDDQNFPICTSILFPSKLSGGEVMSSLEEGCYLQHD